MANDGIRLKLLFSLIWTRAEQQVFIIDECVHLVPVNFCAIPLYPRAIPAGTKSTHLSIVNSCSALVQMSKNNNSKTDFIMRYAELEASSCSHSKKQGIYMRIVGDTHVNDHDLPT